MREKERKKERKREGERKKERTLDEKFFFRTELRAFVLFSQF